MRLYDTATRSLQELPAPPGPVRMYIAPMYGYKSCKWLDAIHVTRAVEGGYWEQRGYDQNAWIGSSNGRDDSPV